MTKERDPKIIVAWITGGLGCLGTICAAVIGGWFAITNNQGSSATIIIPTNAPVVTHVMPTEPETTARIINTASDNICYLYIAPAGSSEWGDDWLGSEGQIYPNESMEFTLDTGMYDLLAQDCDGNILGETYNQHIQGQFSWIVNP